MTSLVLFLLVAPLAAWLLHRDIRRSVRRRELAAKMARLGASFRAAGVAIGASMAPAFGKMIRAASDMQAAMERVNATLASSADLAETGERLRRSGHQVTRPDVAWAMREYVKGERS